MQLPSRLRTAVDAALSGADRTQLGRTARVLSENYRAELKAMHLDSEASALAYLATRLPATYAAIRAALAEAARMHRAFSPTTMLDAGAGPGTALWAASETWSSITAAVLVERSGPIREFSERFTAELELASLIWRGDDLGTGLNGLEPSDLVTLSYVLGEVDDHVRDKLIDRLWSLTRDVLVIVEPGTTAGWMRVLYARDRLVATGAQILAPCPHALACPLAPPDWCHFSRRLARSRIHRVSKGAEVPWEDEKFIYVAVSRRPGAGATARVIAPPRSASGRVNLKLCRNDGRAEWRLISRREGDPYKQARRRDWGDAI